MKSEDYANYLCENLEKSISYTEYLSENVTDSNNSYSEYLAENLDTNINYIDYSDYIDNIGGFQKKLGRVINKLNNKDEE